MSWPGARALRAAIWIEADEEKGKINMVEKMLSTADDIINQRIFILLLDMDSSHRLPRQSAVAPTPAASTFVYSFFFSVHVTATWQVTDHLALEMSLPQATCSFFNLGLQLSRREGKDRVIIFLT